MNCRDTAAVIHGFLDGELDLVRSLAIERHLQDCPECARAYRERQALRAALTDRSLCYDAPPGLQRGVRSAVRQASRAENRAGRWHRRWSWPAVLAPLGAAALVTLLAVPLATRHSAETQLTGEVVSAHVRSLMLDHKTDVASSDQHTVKPWFDGKVDFAPPVIDLAERGFPLVGGRLDYLQGRPVAALVYQRHKHFINLFVWPAPGSADRPREALVRQGYNLVYWRTHQMTFWAVSDLNRAELMELVQLIP